MGLMIAPRYSADNPTVKNWPGVLRHTFASLLLAAGVPVLDVAAQLGHHSAGFTLKVYGHVISRTDRRVADALDTATTRNPGATAEVAR